jgi:hypothetical protein
MTPRMIPWPSRSKHYCNIHRRRILPPAWRWWPIAWVRWSQCFKMLQRSAPGDTTNYNSYYIYIYIYIYIIICIYFLYYNIYIYISYILYYTLWSLDEDASKSFLVSSSVDEISRGHNLAHEHYNGIHIPK